MKLIFFELNEVPWSVIDDFCRHRPSSALAKCLAECHQFETVAADKTALSPWKTWPTVHRGVNDEMHMIHDFGQDLAEANAAYPPLWEILSSHGISTGVCGSLHTHPVPTNLDHYKFFLPDTFALSDDCHPKILSKFQNFNLSMARESPRNVSTRIPWRAAFDFLLNAKELGIRRETIYGVAAHLISERTRPWLRLRRRTYQFVLTFDVFMRFLESTKPQFSTIFTNHVASAMHRYWAAAYPEHYEKLDYDRDWIHQYRNEISFAMTKFDFALKGILEFMAKNPDFRLCVLSSMGQEAVPFSALDTQLYLMDPVKFMVRAGLETHEWSARPAMMPNVNVVVDEGKVPQFRKFLGEIVIDGQYLAFREKSGGFFSFDFGHPNIHDKPQFLRLRGELVPFDQLGLKCVKIEDRSGSSAYHMPNGAMFMYDPATRPTNPSRRKISTLEIAPTVLNLFSIVPPSYMAKPLRPLGNTVVSKVLSAE